MNEPSVLDYVKALLTPWKGAPPAIPLAGEAPEQQPATVTLEAPADASPEAALSAPPAGPAYILEDAWPGAPQPIHPLYLAAGVGLLALAFLIFMVYTSGKYGEPRFNLLDTALTLLATASLGRAFWVVQAAPGQPVEGGRLRRWLAAARQDPLALAGGLLAIGLTLFFRLYRLGSVPPEMNSDHAEKILDILRVLNGEYLIFFAGNGGREALIFYLGALVHLLGLPLGFTALKVVSIGIGLAAQPFIYLFAKEIGGRRVGWLALVLSGVAYWPNVVSRFGLRLPFYILFTAAALYFVLHGLRTARRNDFIYAGIAIGLGFYGYTPDRLLPLTVLAMTALYLLHHRTRPHAQFAFTGLLALGATAFGLFLPLMTYILVQPEAFLARTLTRMANAEQPWQGSALSLLGHNFARALGMFSFDAGVIWPVSIPNHAALGGTLQILFYLGCILAVVRYARRREWPYLFLLLSIPLLLLPSILALAFPDENPNLYRTGGALVPVFVLAALALNGLMRTLADRLSGIDRSAGRPVGVYAAWGLAFIVIAASTAQEYRLVFNDYQRQYQLAAQNTSEMGVVGRSFVDATQGGADSLYVMGFPHWVDSRLVAINAGFAGADFRMFPENLALTRSNPRPKLFFVNPKDQAGILALKQTYPQGWFETVQSQVPGKDFLVFFSLPKENTP